MVTLLRMFDGITPGAMPRGAQLYASYVDGSWPNFHLLPGLFPGRGYVSIAAQASHDADVLDCERLDATPAQCPAWTVRQRKRGKSGTIYCNTSTWPAVRAAFTANGVALPHWWAAQYDGVAQLINDPHCVAKQYATFPNYDDSVVLLSWAELFLPAMPKPKPPAPKPTPIEGNTEMVVHVEVDQNMTGAPPGTKWPGEFWIFPDSGKYVHIEPALGRANNALVFAKAGLVEGGLITYGQHVGFLAAFGGPGTAPTA